MKLESAELILEMLIPEIGAGKDKPYPIPELKFNAQPLRHLSMLWRDPIEVEIENVMIKLPHPADYVLHKKIIQEKRANKDKREKDIQSAVAVLEMLIEKKEQNLLTKVSKKLGKNEKRAVLKVFDAHGFGEMKSLF